MSGDVPHASFTDLYGPVALLFVPVTNIAAQDSIPVTIGTRVRVTAPDNNKYDGTLQAMRGDTLTVAEPALTLHHA